MNMKWKGEYLVYGLVAAAVGLSILACSSGSKEGEKGNIEFVFETGEPLGKTPDFAVGTQIEVRGGRIVENSASEGESGKNDGEEVTTDLTFTEVTSSAPDVIEVEDVEGGRFVLKSKKAGEATIEASAESEDGSAFSDRVTFRAEEVEKLVFEHRCVGDKAKDGTLAGYLDNQTIDVGMRLKDAEDDTLVGYGYYPVSVDGPAELVENYERVGYVGLKSKESAGVVTLEPEIGGNPTQFDVLNQADITGVDWYETTNDVDLGVKVGKEFYLHPLFEVNGRQVCNGDTEYDIQVETPEICGVEAIDGPGDEDLLGQIVRPASTLVVSAKKKGACKFSVGFPKVDADIRKDVEVTVD